MLNFEPLSQAALDQVALDDAANRKRLFPFHENKALPGEQMTFMPGPSPQFFNPPRTFYVMGWHFARRRVYLQTTDPDAFGLPVVFLRFSFSGPFISIEFFVCCSLDSPMTFHRVPYFF